MLFTKFTLQCVQRTRLVKTQFYGKVLPKADFKILMRH